MTRAHDIVLYGATGFTGGLVAEHLARVPGLSWALAGRNRAELEAARARLVGIDPKFAGLPLLDADASDAASLSRMAASARVVITTVGPYAELGEPLVRACVEAGTDYVDLTGEPAFVDRMIAVHGAAAREAKVKIVNACGFDSIPHDMGVLRTVRALDAEGPVRVRGYVEARGQFSGGTWHSAIGAFANPGAVAKARHARKPLLPSALRRVHGEGRLHRVARLGKWACPLPTIDPDVVLRSARVVDGYGIDFTYGHHVAVKSIATIAGGAVAIGGIVALSQFPPTRRWLLKRKAQGDGPSDDTRAKGWFRCTFIGEGDGRTVTTEVSGGDPGYTETAKMLAESALCLVRDRDALPARYGVVTTAEAMDDKLIPRLEAVGIRFRTE